MALCFSRKRVDETTPKEGRHGPSPRHFRSHHSLSSVSDAGKKKKKKTGGVNICISLKQVGNLPVFGNGPATTRPLSDARINRTWIEGCESSPGTISLEIRRGRNGDSALGHHLTRGCRRDSPSPCHLSNHWRTWQKIHIGCSRCCLSPHKLTCDPISAGGRGPKASNKKQHVKLEFL